MLSQTSKTSISSTPSEMGVSDIKTVEEIAMKKPESVADLLSIVDVCIEASKARAHLLDSRNKGPSKKKQ
jgi:hypothetical protein